MSQSTGSSRPRKVSGRPKKPYPDFPLSPHAGGKWQKKIRGKIHYFGRWANLVNGKLQRVPGDGWEEALRIYKDQADDLHAGRTPQVKSDGLNVAELCNHFLTAKTRKRDSGEIGERMYSEYKKITDLLIKQFGNTSKVANLTANHFGELRAAMASHWGPTRLGNAIAWVKSVFKHGMENGLTEKPILYGSEFKKPAKTVMRRHRAQSPSKMIEPEELRKLISSATQPLKAMILLGLNAGLGNNDCSALTRSALNLEAGWLDYPRPKTGIVRKCPLWRETVAAIREALGNRNEPKGETNPDLVFVTNRGTPCVQSTGTVRIDGVAFRFNKLTKKLGIQQRGVGFYTLRHIFRTVADAVRDPVAINLIMGHVDSSMGATYRERVDDYRLRAVVDYVHKWLFDAASDV